MIEKNKESLSECHSLSNLIASWDILKVAIGVINVVGCFVPEYETHVPGPNTQKFIQRPMEHPFSAHFFTQISISSSKGQKKSNKLQSVLQKDLSPNEKSQGLSSSLSENLHWFGNTTQR